MAFDAFLKIDGIPGESKDDKHKDWMEIRSFHFGMQQHASATASSSGGGTSARVDMHDLSVTKLLDKASPKLYEYCCSGKPAKEVTLELCRSGGDKVKYMEVKMEQVIISSVSPSGGDGGAEPSEALSLSFGKVKWTYTQQKREDGTPGGNVSSGWDLTANKVSA